jgi:2,3-dihydroxyphenylpropionate 1,2-dioxygenase
VFGVSLSTLTVGALGGSSEDCGIGAFPRAALWFQVTVLELVMQGHAVNSTVIGGAMLPHAPQFFTMPETEDRDTVERVRATAVEIGARLKALAPDLWIIFSNDHAEQFFHQTAPPFTIHVGDAAEGKFAGRNFRWKVPSEIGLELVRQLYRQGFDPAFTSVAKIDYAMGIPLTHLGVVDPVLPIYINAYLPPQPTMERCYAFGQAVARIVTAMGLRTAVVASGGMSHFPGTERYPHPELAWDKAVMAQLGTGNLKSLIGWDEAALDAAGNVELRCWAAAAGALGERKPDIAALEPSWHHNYASLGFFTPPSEPSHPHYPAIKPELVELTTALHGLAHDEDRRGEYLADPAAYAGHFRLTPPQRTALLGLDTPALVKMGVHPLVAFLANMQVERQRKS